MGAITPEEQWQFFRSLRNNLAHDYPESAVQTAGTRSNVAARHEEQLIGGAEENDSLETVLNSTGNRGVPPLEQRIVGVVPTAVCVENEEKCAVGGIVQSQASVDS